MELKDPEKSSVDDHEIESKIDLKIQDNESNIDGVGHISVGNVIKDVILQGENNSDQLSMESVSDNSLENESRFGQNFKANIENEVNKETEDNPNELSDCLTKEIISEEHNSEIDTGLSKLDPHIDHVTANNDIGKKKDDSSNEPEADKIILNDQESNNTESSLTKNESNTMVDNKIDKSKSDPKYNSSRPVYIAPKLNDKKNNARSSEPCKIIDIHDSTEMSMGKNEDGVEGRVKYFKHFLTEEEATELYDSLVKDIPWQLRDSVNKSGEKFPEPRMTYWFGKAYKYSAVTWSENNEWNPMIQSLRDALSNDPSFCEENDRQLNSVMCNYYRDHNDSIGWHADDETSLGRCPKIASISLGCQRVFEVCKREEYFTRQDKPRDDNAPFSGCTIMYRFHLGHGSLLVMDGSVQDLWLHHVPKENADMKGRINLTFRYIVDKEEEEKEIEHKRKVAKERRLKNMQPRPRNDNRSYNDDRRYNDNRHWRDDYHVGYYNRDYYNEREERYVVDRSGNQWQPRFHYDRAPRQEDGRRRHNKSWHFDDSEMDEGATQDYREFLRNHYRQNERNYQHGQSRYNNQNRQFEGQNQNWQYETYNNNRQTDRYTQNWQTEHYDNNRQADRHDNNRQTERPTQNRQAEHQNHNRQPQHYDNNGQPDRHTQNRQMERPTQNRQPEHHDNNRPTEHHDNKRQADRHDNNRQPEHHDNKRQAEVHARK